MYTLLMSAIKKQKTSIHPCLLESSLLWYSDSICQYPYPVKIRNSNIDCCSMWFSGEALKSILCSISFPREKTVTTTRKINKLCWPVKYNSYSITSHLISLWLSWTFHFQSCIGGQWFTETWRISITCLKQLNISSSSMPQHISWLGLVEVSLSLSSVHRDKCH